MPRESSLPSCLDSLCRDGLTPHALASLESSLKELSQNPNNDLSRLLLRSIPSIKRSDLQGLNDKFESLVMDHTANIDIEHMLVLTQLLNGVSPNWDAPPQSPSEPRSWDGLISSIMIKATSLVNSSNPPEHTPSGRERWFSLGANTSYTITAWVKFTDEMNTEVLSVRDDDGVRVRLTLTDTSWVAESYGVQGHKVEKIGEVRKG